MPQLLFLSLRDGEIGPAVARAEYHDVLQSAGLEEGEGVHRIIDGPPAAIGPLDGIAGGIAGGSSLNVPAEGGYSAYQKHVHALLADLVERDLPVFFVCFGLSWLVHYAGGEGGRSHPEDSGPTTVCVTEEGRADVLLGPAPDTFTALTGHTENPETVPGALQLLATTPDGAVQIVRYRDRVWATQFHAEMDAAAMQTRMDFYHDYGYFPAEEYARIVADLPNHDVAAANGLVQSFARYCFAEQTRPASPAASN
ncbi:glutamine amidotransferase-related protein [Corynebacterium bouchesdurhonense]|uniref:glutamine amidotransferase-related protein n=1 Tax=Corynebacterium bouchesdurhonense TaxID=1720192 RepID=UPI00082B0A2A|nr:glutamine amidotransferase [Corynebacterium bouchesdurhonense]